MATAKNLSESHNKHLLRYNQNPFVNVDIIKGFKTELKFHKVKEASIGNLKTGEHYGEGLYTQVKKTINKENFVQFYSKMQSLWFEFSPASTKVFGAVYQAILEAPIGLTYIFLHPDDELVRCHLKSRTQFYKGIKELCELELIARHKSENLYWVNPNMICKGDKVKVVADIIIENNKKNKK